MLKHNSRKTAGLALLVPLSFLLSSCDNFLSHTADDFGEMTYEESIEDWEGWTSASHGEGADPDYEQLFDSNTTTVHRIDITIDNDYYQKMEDDMESLYGSFGSSGSLSSVDDDPIFVPITLEFNDQTWWYVAMRYKGNSSLRDAWQSGNHKLPFRLNFDYYDDVWEVIEGQRFWGFQKMTFSNGKDDDTMIRDVLASETFQKAGIEAARATFCRVYIDVNDGNGAVYWGLYAMIEDPSDQMLDEQFGSSSGNLYKPDDEENSTLSEDNYSSAYYDKANNEDEGDWSDIKSFIYTIEDEDKPSYSSASVSNYNNDSWQSEIEALFDVDRYLDYLAVNNTIQNWDVYGSKAHNYYLYADPSDSDRFSWFPWDMNESFKSSTSSDSRCLSIDVESDYTSGNYDGWPLLENVIAQSDYRDLYDQKISEYFVDSGCALDETTLDSWITTYSNLVEEYVLDEIDGYTWLDDGFDNSDYADAVGDLEDQLSTRISRAESYVGN